MKKIFISHSSNDKKFVECLVELLENMGVPSDRIFCTSLEGYGTPLGEKFLDKIREEFNEDTIVLFIISANFYNSPICLCEMGAAWVKCGIHIPILIPPFDFHDVKGIISQTQGLKINDKNRLNTLCNTIRGLLGIAVSDESIWERKRDRFLSDIHREIIASLGMPGSPLKTSGGINEPSEGNVQDPFTMGRFDDLIQDVRDKLGKLPWIVRKGLYYHFSERDFMLDRTNGEDEWESALKAAEDDYLMIDGKWMALNAGDPKIRKAMESLGELKCFLEGAGREFHGVFEEKHEICAKIESRKFWRMMGIL